MLLNVRQVSEELNISVGMVWKLIRGGALPPTRIGTRVLIRRQALIRFIMRASRQPSAGPVKTGTE